MEGDDAGAGILSSNNDVRDLEDDYAHDEGVRLNAYRVRVTEKNGDTESVQLAPTAAGNDV